MNIRGSRIPGAANNPMGALVGSCNGRRLTLCGRRYFLFDTIPEGAGVCGELANPRYGKAKEKDVTAYVLHGDKAAPVYRYGTFGRLPCAGYLKRAGAEEYIAVRARRGWLPLLLLLILAAAVLLCWRGCTPGQAVSSDLRTGELASANLSAGEIQRALDAMTEEGMYQIKLNMSPSLSDGKLNLRYDNQAINSISTRFDVEIAGELQYASEVVEPGQYVEYCTLLRPERIPKEEREGVVTISFLGGDGKPYNTAQVVVQLSRE